jgi:hypothetical protein
VALDPRFLKAEELGIRLEVVSGLPIWEAHRLETPEGSRPHPTIHQSARCCMQLRARCRRVRSVQGWFSQAPGRRDICREPDEQEDAITLIPEAVVEVVSKGYEAKDLEIGPPFYLAQGVKDVIVFDPTSLLVLHARTVRTTRQVSPQAIELSCGCTLTV